jgi:hypothetical protein
MPSFQPIGPADIVNRATVLMGGFNSNVPITGVPPTFDGTPLGLAAGAAYGGVVQTIGKSWGWDFERSIATLVPSGGTPPMWWSAEYLYPTNGIEIRQVVLPTMTDPNNAVPVRWTVGNSTVAGITSRIIWCNISGALAVITSTPPEGAWDAGFTEQVIRLLASEMAMGVAGRPETGQLEYERSNNSGQAFQRREG